MSGFPSHRFVVSPFLGRFGPYSARLLKSEAPRIVFGVAPHHFPPPPPPRYAFPPPSCSAGCEGFQFLRPLLRRPQDTVNSQNPPTHKPPQNPTTPTPPKPHKKKPPPPNQPPQNHPHNPNHKTPPNLFSDVRVRGPTSLQIFLVTHIRARRCGFDSQKFLLSSPLSVPSSCILLFSKNCFQSPAISFGSSPSALPVCSAFRVSAASSMTLRVPSFLPCSSFFFIVQNRGSCIGFLYKHPEPRLLLFPTPALPPLSESPQIFPAPIRRQILPFWSASVGCALKNAPSPLALFQVFERFDQILCGPSAAARLWSCLSLCI